MQSSFSFGAANVSEDEYDEIILPPPRPNHYKTHQERSRSLASVTTPLVVPRARKHRNRQSNSSFILFGNEPLGWQKGSQTISPTHDRPEGIVAFLFGFMMEDPMLDDDDCMLRQESHAQRDDSLSRSFMAALALGFLLTSAAASTPVTLIPLIGNTFLMEQDTIMASAVSAFASKATASSVLGLAIGKFVNGPLADILGARRVSIAFAMLLAITLVLLSVSWNEASSLWACFFVDFFQTVQWPGIIIILASHSKGKTFENGVFIVSLASRLASLLTIPLTLFMLRHLHWRAVALWASALSIAGATITLTLVRDSPTQWHNPQNPISASAKQAAALSIVNDSNPSILKIIFTVIKTILRVVKENVVPSMKQVLTSTTFWIVAVAHAGDAIVATSQRMLGMYFYDTSGGALTSSRASGYAVVLSIGTITGLAIAGNIFKSSNPRGRQRLIVRLYTMSICACYLLAALALPRIQRIIGDTGLTLSFQLICTVFMGFGCAVQSMIPGILGGNYGKNKGLFSAYTDGIAFGLSSVVWRIVGCAVHVGDSSGWAYGWAAVALLMVVCALLMVEFFHHFFVQPAGRTNIESDRMRSGYETILFV